ncbi:MAG: CcmD family protein [Chloroflexi bacterium]|nr:CcmD family protein [Chloroflexota bacterium]
MNNLGYLFAAYTIIWLVLFAYSFRLARRVEELRQRLEALGRRRQTSDGQAGATPLVSPAGRVNPEPSQ